MHGCSFREKSYGRVKMQSKSLFKASMIKKEDHVFWFHDCILECTVATRGHSFSTYERKGGGGRPKAYDTHRKEKEGWQL